MRKSILVFSIAVVLGAISFGVWWFSRPPAPENLQLTADQWRDDLRFIVRELPKRHANAFHFTSQPDFEKAAAALDAQLPQLNSDQSWVGLQRLVSLVGDAHTYLQTPHDAANLPLDVMRFGSDYRVDQVDPAYANLLGTRVTKIGGATVEQAADRCKELFSRDENPDAPESFVDACLTTGAALHGLGITPDRNSASYAVVDDSGKDITVEVKSPSADANSAEPLNAYKEPPLYLKDSPDKFACQYLEQGQTLYCNVRAIRDLKPGVAAMMKLIEQHHPVKLAIDLRRNRGGDNHEGENDLIHPIRDLAAFNSRGKLFVLIGRDTFSAAMNNAAQFRQQTAAILVGEEIGEKPNSYQEADSTTLPNSHLRLHYSVKYYKFVDGPDNAVRPDKEIIPTWDDYKAGIDPVLDWVQAYK
jgi:hypothetical protein